MYLLFYINMIIKLYIIMLKHDFIKLFSLSHFRAEVIIKQVRHRGSVHHQHLKSANAAMLQNLLANA